MMIKAINSVLLPFQGNLYLLPMIALAEVLPTFSYLPFSQESNSDLEFLLGKVLWRGIHLPLITPDLKFSPPNKLTRPRIAVLNALFSSDKHVPYFALMFEQAPIRMAFKEKDIHWQDATHNRIKRLQQFASWKEIIMVDLQKLSAQVERTLIVLGNM